MPINEPAAPPAAAAAGAAPAPETPAHHAAADHEDHHADDEEEEDEEEEPGRGFCFETPRPTWPYCSLALLAIWIIVSFFWTLLLSIFSLQPTKFSIH